MPTHRIIGAFFFAFLIFGTFSCEKKRGNRDWDADGIESVPSANLISAPPTKVKGREKPSKSVTDASEQAPVANARSSSKESGKGGLRFISYNVENWLTMDRFVNKKIVQSAPKPDAEKSAVIQILVDHSPDVIGICEIGEASDLREIQGSLKTSGLDLPYFHYCGGSDPVRHLGLLSRYPIISTTKPTVLEYRMQGKTLGFNRGILDATITANGKTYRFIGVHLKSKRDTEEGDQEQMRINEAHLLRNHVNSIFQSEPNARMVVYGDFNDTYPSKAVRAITGNTEKSERLIPIYFKDSHGEAWTHHWRNQDIYSRIDFVTLSPAMHAEVNFKNCRIIDDPRCMIASDHRPILTIFK